MSTVVVDNRASGVERNNESWWNQQTPAMRPSSNRSPSTPAESDEITFLASILKNAGNDASARTTAAVRLMNRGNSDAMRPLDDAIRLGDSALQLIVLVAIAQATEPPPELLDALVEALLRAPNAVLDPISQAVSRYGDRGFALIRIAANSRDLPVSQRLRAIHALGAFRTRAAALELMIFLDPIREESDEVKRAACASLRRGTGLNYGDDPEVWRAWWRDARHQPQEQWMAQIIQRIDARLQRSEQQVLRLERRLHDAYRDLFPITLSTEEQMNRLAGLMQDELPPLRSFALDRIARLLRDSVRIPEELQFKIADMLADDVPAIRIQTARLLEQLNVDVAADRISRRLAAESSHDVAAAYMDVLQRRPVSRAVEAVLPWLADQSLGEKAAVAAWEVIRTMTVDDLLISRLYDALLAADRWRVWPGHARLFGAVGSDADARRLETFLDGDDPNMRRAAAEAMLHRGAHQVLLNRAADEVVYPYAVQSLGRDPVDLNSLRAAIGLAPTTESCRTAWSQTIRSITGKLPIASLIEADDLLAASPDATPQLRAQLLSRVRGANGELDSAMVTELLTRLAKQQLLLDQPQAALETMESLNGPGLPDAARRVKFEAAIRAAHYETAALLEPAPAPWVALLARLTESHIPSAVLLREEINRRFSDVLNGELLENFDRLSERLARERSNGNSRPPA